MQENISKNDQKSAPKENRWKGGGVFFTSVLGLC